MTTRKIAAEFAPGSKMVQLVDRGIVMERAEAEALGYTVSASIASATPAPLPNAARANNAAILKQSWRAAIIASPEAKGRDDATAEILVRHSPGTLSVDDARAFLRGLPTEQPERNVSNVTTNTDPRAARKAEIAASINSFNSDRGYRRATTGQGSTANLAGVDSVKLKRLAELRLNALESGQAARVGDEARKLRYAVQVHDQTGSPLTQVFSQLGIDTTMFVK